MVLAVRWTGYPPPSHLLAYAERKYAQCLPAWRARQWMTGRLTARAALQLYLRGLPADLEILPGSDGAPVLTGTDMAPHVLSIAHCDEWAACACGPAGHALGVDVEEAGACDDMLLARVSGPGETHPGPAMATYGWGRKEAAFKACRGVPPVLTCYRLAGSSRVVASSGAAQADRVLATWSASLPGAVLTVASTDPRRPLLRVLDARDAVTTMSGQSGRRWAGELAHATTRQRIRWHADA
jgi:4'-phosphopantetheinyl transferase N-terminal domain